jgi:tryptophan synthase beta chain
LIEAVAVDQLPAFESAIQFARTEGIVPAPESAHAIRAAVDEALAAREKGKAKTILFGLSGHGNFDLAAYQEYLAGNLTNYAFPQEGIDAALHQLPTVAAD